MIRDWLDTKEVVTFAQGLARDINRLFPPAPDTKAQVSSKKDFRKLDSIILRTRNFAQQHKLNVYKKAKLLNTIKWELRDAGQDAAMVDAIVASLTPLLN
jgi:hypothetical protein